MSYRKITTIDEYTKDYSRNLIALKIELDDLKRITEHKIAKSKAQATMLNGKVTAATSRIDKTATKTKDVAKDVMCERKIQKHLKHKLIVAKKKMAFSQEDIRMAHVSIDECNSKLGIIILLRRTFGGCSTETSIC